MHILFLSLWLPPHKPTTAREIADHSIAASFKRNGAEISFMGFQKTGVEPRQDMKNICVETLDNEAEQTLEGNTFQALKNSIFGGTTLKSAHLQKHHSKAFEQAIETARPFDAIIISDIDMAAAFYDIFKHMQHIYIAHNAQKYAVQSKRDMAENLLTRAILKRESKALLQLEKQLITNASFVLTTSQKDRATLNLSDEQKCGVATAAIAEAAGFKDGRAKGFDIGMVADWRIDENRLALEWMIQKVSPHLPDGITLAIAGPRPPGFPRRDKKLMFLDAVLNERDFARQCRVIALSARAQTGIYANTFEALNLGLPAVATHASIEGVVSAPHNVQISDNPKQFAKKLSDLVLDVRTNMIESADGGAFRSKQNTQMDSVTKAALLKISA